MTIHFLLLILLSQTALVSGQLCLKRGMNMTREGTGRVRVAGCVGAGVAMLTLWFLVWMGLLQRLDLSYVYPFEGISPILLVIAASVILKETLSRKAWIGVGLITLGTLVVGWS